MPHAVAIAVAEVVASVGAAAAGAGAVGLGTALTAGASFIAANATLIGSALLLGGQLLLSNLMRPGVPPDPGTQVQFKADTQAPIPYIIGRTGTAGNIVFVATAGSKNKYLNYVTVYSGAGPLEQLESFAANTAVISFTADSGEGASGQYLNRMWLRSQLGATPEASYLHYTATGSKDTPANHSGLPPEWGASHKLSGYAATLWGLEYDPAKYSSGTPKPLAVWKGVKAYDPRLDSTYPGGSGAHRSNDESTWTYSENPYLHGLTWLLGRNQNGKRVLGCGLPIQGIDVPAFVEGANVADAHGWKVGGVVYSTNRKWDVLKLMLQAGAGEPVRVGAMISCRVDAPRVSLATLTGDAVIGDVSVPATQPRRSRINRIWPRYREETQAWQVVATAEPITVAAYVTLDGGLRSKEVEYSLCQDASQAATLARYDIENAREFGPFTLPCKPQWMGFKPGDCLTINEPEFGMQAQKALILSRQVDPASLATTFTLRSETDAKHAFALGQTGNPPPTPSLSVIDLSNVPAPSALAWSVVGTTFTDNGVSLPGIVATALLPADETDNANAQSVIFEFRVAGATDWTPCGEEPYTVRRKEIGTQLTPGTAYDVAISYRVRGVAGQRLVFSSVVAGSFAVGAGRAALILSQSVAYPITSTDTTIDVEAFDANLDVPLNGSWTVSIPARTPALNGLIPQTRYGLFYRPADDVFGVEYYPATGPMGDDRNVFVQWVLTADTGGATYTPPTNSPPPGYGGYGQIDAY